MSSDNMIESTVYQQRSDSFDLTPVALVVLTGADTIRHLIGRLEDSASVSADDKHLADQLAHQMRTAKAGKPTLEVARHHELWELAERISDDEERESTNRWVEGILADRFGYMPDDMQGAIKNGMTAVLDALARDTSVRADRLRDRLLYRHGSVLVGAA